MSRPPESCGIIPDGIFGSHTHKLHEKLMSQDLSISDIAESQGVHRSYVSRLIRLAFLSPEITEAILDGRQPLGLTAARLMRVSRLPLDWRAQRQALDFS